MRKYFKIALFAFTLVLVGISCQKEVSSPENQNDVFNEKAAKEWYYGTFKKSAEWAASNLKGKKLPDWKHPVAGKLGNYDIAEFPLVSGSTSFPIYSNQANRNLASADLSRLANASVSKIIFFKGKSGEIFVREIDFIPDWDYLKEKKYDISNISILNKEEDFSGNIIVKKWDGSLVSSVMYKNGHQTMKSKLIRVSNDGENGEINSIETLVCTDYQFCIWQQDCEIVINGDQMTTICEEWYNTGDCWIETYCEEDTDDCVLTGTCETPGEDTWELDQSKAHLCGVYNWGTIGAAWYTKLNPVGFSLVNTNGEIRTFTFWDPCISIAKSSAATTQQANEAFNQAWNQAADKVLIDFNTSGGALGDALVKDKMKNYLQSYLNINNPGSTFNPLGCAGNIPQSPVSYCP